MAIRNTLISIALAFGAWETSDIPDTGAMAAVFAILFFACSVWLWRRSSRIAAVVLALQFTVEATQVAASFLARSLHTLRDTAPATTGGAHDE